VAVRPLVGIVAAAGSGERLGSEGPKAFVSCGGRPMLEWSVEALSGVCDRVVVAVPPDRVGSAADRVAGGDSRSESVRRAMEAAPEAACFVVQDAARPLLTAELVERCVAAVGDGWDGAVAAAPLTDTVKQAAADGGVERTLDRSRLWAIQTPQAFSAQALRRALDADPATLAAATDDAALVEGGGGRVTVIEAPAENIKVTTALDLTLAELLLRDRTGT
jgi:2-C-methyl-D-erythritol 4-phosphate cytidylyltransferase